MNVSSLWNERTCETQNGLILVMIGFQPLLYTFIMVEDNLLRMIKGEVGERIGGCRLELCS